MQGILDAQHQARRDAFAAALAGKLKLPVEKVKAALPTLPGPGAGSGHHGPRDGDGDGPGDGDRPGHGDGPGVGPPPA